MTTLIQKFRSDMTKQQREILWCMEQNLANARTKAAQSFASELLQSFRHSLAKKAKPRSESPFSRFVDKLENKP